MAVYLLGSHRLPADPLVNLPGHPRPGAYIEDWCCAICRRCFELY
jgi:hypothetical protein